MWRMLVCAILLWVQPARSAQSWSFDDFERTVTKLSLNSNLSPHDVQDISAISKLVGSMHSRYIEAFGPGSDSSKQLSAHLSREYIQSLIADNLELDNLPSTIPDRSRILREVRQDLELKENLTSDGLNASAGFPSVVKVTVDTQKNGKSIGGLWVRANPRRYGVTQQPLIIFNSASTPTTANFPPGLFVLWVESANKTFLASQPIAVGVGGKESEQIVFALP